MKANFLLALLVFSLGTMRQAWAHGEERPGPHGGFIRMPGAFHTEVIPMEGGYKVVLLDIELRNPWVSQSSVKGYVARGGELVRLDCTKHSDHFFCRLPAGASGTEGRLELDASRAGGPAGRASYSLPLRLQEEAPADIHRHH